MKNKPCCFHGLREMRGRDVAAIFAMVVVVGVPLVLVQPWLLGPSGRVFSVLSSRFAVSADVLTLAGMIVYCTLLGLAMFAGDRLLRRFLSR